MNDRKDTGSVFLIVILLLLVTMLLGISVINVSSLNTNTAYLFYDKVQSNTAARYAIQKYIESTENNVINGNPLSLSGIMGSNNKYDVTWDATEKSAVYTIPDITNNIAIYSMYPTGSESFSSIGNISGDTMQNMMLAGSYVQNINSSEGSVNYYDVTKSNYIRNEILLDKLNNEGTVPISDSYNDYFGMFDYWDSSINTLDEVYVVASNDSTNNETDITVYQYSPDNGGTIKTILTTTVPNQCKCISVTGTFSSVLNNGVGYVTIVQSNGNIEDVYQFFTGQNTFTKIHSFTNSYQGISTTAVWNSVLDVPELYVMIANADNSFNVYSIKSMVETDLGYESMLPIDVTNNFVIGAYYDNAARSTVIYFLNQSAKLSKVFDMYRYISGSGAGWISRGSTILKYPGRVLLQGINTPDPEYILVNYIGSIEYESSDISCDGYVFEKYNILKTQVAKTEISCHVDITYSTDVNGVTTASKLNVSDVTVK
jgi:hypothetical protein